VSVVRKEDFLEKEDDVAFLGNEFFNNQEVILDEDKTFDKNNEPNQVAVVGFWKLDRYTKNYECYSTMTVPDPIKKPAHADETAVFCEVLYNGEDNNIFYFFKDSDNLEYYMVELSEKDLERISRESREDYVSQVEGSQSRLISS
jgi:hypothetical protein